MTTLYEAHNHILIRTGYADPGPHRHMAAHILICLEGDMQVTAEGEEHLCRGVLIPSGVRHRIDTHGGAVLVFLYPCTAPPARQIQSLQCIPEACCQDIARMYTAFTQGGGEGYGSFQQAVLARLGLSGTPSGVTDRRILAALDYIRANFPHPITCREAAGAVHLSQSRFSHLFREQVGMTFAAYLICQRLLHVYAQTLRGRSVTEAALEAGFSSSSHFADVNRRVFGIPISRLTRDVTLIRVQ